MTFPAFSRSDWFYLSDLFSPSYAGYRPKVVEAPNGDGNLDSGKRYLHIALKYNPPAWALDCLARAHASACLVAESLKVPAQYYPRIADATLRVLEYPIGAGSAEHTDFDLFTLNLWRNTPEDHEQFHVYGQAPLDDLGVWEKGCAPYHLGELGELIGLGPAVKHRVQSRSYQQQSIVYFAMPDHAAVLPVGDDWGHLVPGTQTVGEWLKERVKRSRYE